MSATPQSFGPVGTIQELQSLVNKIASDNAGSLLLFRGQTTLHDAVRSSLSRPNVRYEPDVERGFSAIAGQILGHESVTVGNVPFRRAVLQHYGVKTQYVDLTSDPKIAAWFATNTLEPRNLVYGGTPLRKLDQSRYKRRVDGLGYMLVFGIPNAAELLSKRRLFDISKLDPFLRPCRQQAWLLSDRRPLLPDPNDFWIATITINCSEFESVESSKNLFPLPSEDAGYKALLNIPFVEVPNDWLCKDDTDLLDPKRLKIVFGMRALPVPEYVHNEKIDEYDHKWSDRTLTEPEPMQMWVRWQFELGDQLLGVQGNVANAVKLTLSPRAKQIIDEPWDDLPLRWPSLGSDELLFTFSQYGYDKVDEIDFPYQGVWLHRDKELIIEHPMTADRDTLNVHAGHVFEFIGQDLQMYDLPTSCACNSPESHETRVRAMLRLSTLIEAEMLVLIPHPLHIPNWYIVL